MALIYSINNYTIPAEHILSVPKYSSKVIINNAEMIASQLDITLNIKNIDDYDDRIPGSLFYDADFFRWPVTIYDNDKGIYIWKGRIKNVKLDAGNETVTVSTTNYIQDLADTIIEYDNSTDTTETIAETVYKLLTDTTMAAISVDDIVYSGFQDAINIQSANSIYAECYYLKENNITLLTVIQELCRISNCSLYPVDNKLHFYQYQDWNGEIGLQVGASDIIAKSYRHEYKDEMIYNDVSIVYDNSGTLDRTGAELSDSASITQYGKKSFLVPNADISSTSSDDVKILLRSQTPATYLANLTLNRFKYIKKFCDFETTDKLDYLKLNSIARLNFNPFVNEPVRICEVQKDKNTIQFKGEFLNTPHEYFSRDVAPPAAPMIDSVIGIDSRTAVVRFTKSQNTDISGYKLYFTTCKGEWFREMSNIGFSPVDIKNPSLTPDGFCYILLSQLSAGQTYYFKMKSYDVSMNESDDSNTVECILPISSQDAYRLSGTIYSRFVTDRTNPYHGIVPDDYHVYGDGSLYGEENYQPASFFTSPVYYSNSGISKMTWKGSGSITMDYRTSSDGTTFSLWSTEIDAIANRSCLFPGSPHYMQYRFIFHAISWNNTDYIYLKNIG